MDNDFIVVSVINNKFHRGKQMDHSILFKTASALCLLFGFAASAYATPIDTIKDYTIWDNHDDKNNNPNKNENENNFSYWGGESHGYGDVIGAYDQFDIQKAVINRDNKTLTIDIYTGFVSNGGLGSFTGSTYGKGIGMGDLFLTSNWSPAGTAANHYQKDNSKTTGTSWNYVVSLGDKRWDKSGDTFLYEITDSTSYLTSNDFLSGGTFRDDQLIAVKFDEGLGHINKKARWEALTIPDSNVSNASTDLSVSRFTMDISGTGLETGAFGMHWGMTCGNDVIEGDPPAAVPEPASMSLLSLGLIGMGFVSLRRRVNKK